MKSLLKLGSSSLRRSNYIKQKKQTQVNYTGVKNLRMFVLDPKPLPEHKKKIKFCCNLKLCQNMV